MTNYEKQTKINRKKCSVIFAVVAILVLLSCVLASIFGFGSSADVSMSHNSGIVEWSSGIKLADTGDSNNCAIRYNFDTKTISQDFAYSVLDTNSNVVYARITYYLKQGDTLVAKSTFTRSWSDSDGSNFERKENYHLGERNSDIQVAPPYDIPLDYLFYDCESTGDFNNHVKVSMSYDTTYTLYAEYRYARRAGTITKMSNTVSFTVESPSLPLPETPSKHGYTFAGWYYDEALTNPYDGGKITADTKLYAKMDVIHYSVSYNANNGTVSGKTEYNIESETYTLPIPTRTGYTFKGWYTTEDFSGAAVSSIPKGSTGDKAFYAKWEIQVFKVSFYVDGELYLEMDVEYGTKLVDLYLVDSVTLQAVAFSLDSSMLTAYDPNSKITNDLSLFASKDFVVKAGLTYNIDGVETMDLLDYNSTLSDLRTPTKDGYTFDGWYYDAEYTQAVKSTDKLTSNKTIFAKFTEIPPETFGDKVAAFFSDWWWCFAVGGAAVIAIVVFSILYTQKRKV